MDLSVAAGVWFCREAADVGNLICLGCGFQNTGITTTTINRFSSGGKKVLKALAL